MPLGIMEKTADPIGEKRDLSLWNKFLIEQELLELGQGILTPVCKIIHKRPRILFSL